MKIMNTTRIVLAMGLGAACWSGDRLWANDTVKETAVAKALRSVPAAELPARAAQLVKEAKEAEQEFTTIAVVKASVKLKPASTLIVVGVICKTSPKVAPMAAATAAKLQPQWATAITKCAVAAAPSQAGKIVAAVCKEVPSESSNVVAVAVRIAPSSSHDILEAVWLALSGAPSVAMTPPRPPIVGPPFEPLPSAPTNNTTSATTGNVPPPCSRCYDGP